MTQEFWVDGQFEQPPVQVDHCSISVGSPSPHERMTLEVSVNAKRGHESEMLMGVARYCEVLGVPQAINFEVKQLLLSERVERQWGMIFSYLFGFLSAVVLVILLGLVRSGL